ncbi:DUF2690 domain-containing protein [Streptomyces sp. NPDC047002]|uniref:DUF2690 domain-containing protein n=1 Tax=Streptomyces sp. NPDC047002 TaxID=3155475 RepID=UPI0034521CF7
MARRATDPAGELADRMRELIDRSGLSLDAVAARTGLSRADWAAYVRGVRRPPREATAALAEAVGTYRAPLLELWDRAELRARSEGAVPEPYPEYPGERSTVRLPAVAAEPAGDPGERRVPEGPGESAGATAPLPRHVDRARRPGHARTLTLVSTAVGVALVVLAVVLLTGLGGGGDAPAAAGQPSATDATDATNTAGAPHATGRTTAPPSAPSGQAAPPRPTGPTAAPSSPSSLSPSPPSPPSSPSSSSPSASTGAVPPSGVRCAPGTCAGADPEAMGCASGRARTLATSAVGGAFVEVRYSAVCGAAWGRVTGSASGGTLLVTPGGTPVPAQAGTGTGTYTPMVAAPEPHGLRACLTLGTGAKGCATAR